MVKDREAWRATIHGPLWDKALAGVSVGTLAPASNGNSPIGHHHHHLTRAATGDKRTAPVLLSQDPPRLLPATESPPTLCTNLAAWARPGFPRPPASTGLALLPGVRGAQGRHPSPSRPVRPGVPPPGFPAVPSRHRPLRPVPSLWAKPTRSAAQGGPHLAMAEPGEQLPEEVLVLIFRHLPLPDRAAAARVCRAWAAAATCSAVWHDTSISCDCELEGMLPPYLSACLDHVQNLWLEFEPSRKSSRRAATDLLAALAGRTPGLRGLCLECRGEKPLFDAGRDVLDAVHALCGAARALRHLDLRRLPFSLDDALVLQVAHGCPELRSLFLDNRTLVGSVGPGSVLELLEACPCLRALGLHLASLSRTALEALAAPERAPFELLALRCACPEDARARPLPDEAWAALSRRHPGLEVELELEPVLPAESVTRVLQPAVPVAALRLSLSGDTVGPVRFAARHYAATLRALEVRAAASAELDAALEELAARCAGLREVHCFCVVRPSVLHAFRARCPRLRSYTLKLTREPHPWRPTLVA